MATTSTKFQFQLPEGTDVMDNDKYIKGNFQKIEDNVLKKSESISSTNLTNVRIETIEHGVNVVGGTNSVTASIAFSKPFTNPPTIMAANITQGVSYADAIMYPYFTNVTTLQFTVRIMTVNPSDFLGAGLLKMKFVAIGN